MDNPEKPATLNTRQRMNKKKQIRETKRDEQHKHYQLGDGVGGN